MGSFRWFSVLATLVALVLYDSCQLFTKYKMSKSMMAGQEYLIALSVLMQIA